MISESCAFLLKIKNPSFKVHLVVFDPEQHTVFKTELQNASSTPMKPKPTKISSSAASLAASYELTSSSAPDFTIQGIQISIVEGDITKESTDAVVNTTSPDIALKASGQVSAALLKLCGSKLQDLCTTAVQSEGNLTEGKVICTKALKPLNCTSLFHIYFNSNDPIKYVQTVKACLLKAEQLQYRSITLPAIGTGAHKYPISEAVKGTLAGVKEFALSNPQNVKLIRIVIYDHAIYDCFASATVKQLDTETSLKLTVDHSNSSFTVDSNSELGSESDSHIESDSSCSNDEWSDLNSDDGWSETIQNSEPEPAKAGLLTQGLSMLSKLWSSDHDATKASADDSAVTEKASPTGLRLCICGFNEREVQDATKRLNELMKINFNDAYINEDVIKSLNEEECETILRECRGLGVKCNIETDIGQIRLTGNVKDINRLRTKVHSIIISVMSRNKEEHGKAIERRCEIETFFKSIHWQYKKPGTDKYEDYDKEISFAIEQAFHKFQADRRRYKFSYEDGPCKFVINFRKLEEKNGKTGKTSNVKRFHKDGKF